MVAEVTHISYVITIIITTTIITTTITIMITIIGIPVTTNTINIMVIMITINNTKKRPLWTQISFELQTTSSPFPLSSSQGHSNIVHAVV